jgi:hypothetical protein
MQRNALPSFLRRATAYAALSFALVSLGGCTVITVATIATDLAVGAVKLTGKAVGAAVDLVVPDGDEQKK